MSKTGILKPGQPYIFQEYFDLPFEPEDIFAELGYHWQHDTLELRRGFVPQERISELQARITRSLRCVSLNSGGARREVLIAPILLEVVDLTQAQLRIEYPVHVNDHLQGTIDYYLYKDDRKLIVSEARHADLGKGFTQLAAQMIGLNCWTNEESNTFMGAVSTGDIWKFGVLHTPGKVIWQDVNLLRVPADLEELMKILVGALLP